MTSKKPSWRELAWFFVPSPRARRGVRGNSTEFPRHQLDKDKLGDPMTMFGKDDDPFKGGKEEKSPSCTGGEGQACAEARASMGLRGRCWHSAALPTHAPRLRRRIILDDKTKIPGED